MADTTEVKETFEHEKIIAELAKKIRQLQGEVDRKNEALEGLLAENEALKDELGGRKKRVRPGAESLETKIERWKKRS